MPGMLETVLDVGLTAHSVQGLIRLTGNPRLAWDCYRRLVQSYAEVVALLPTEPFDAILRQAVEAEQAESERDLDFRALRTVTRAMLDRFQALSGAPFPDDPSEQLRSAAEAVFHSWEGAKSVSYRRLNDIRDDIGTAVTVQTMVFGNAGGASGSGVGFTRDPATGERALYFDFCFNGQGEDVVSGRRRLADDDRLLRVLPAIHAELLQVRARLETLFGDAQDFEFTVQDGTLYLLQTRTAKRTPLAALRIAVEMVEERLITPAEALLRLRDVDLDAVGRTRFAPPLPAPLAVATVAGPGVASGPLALDTAAAERFALAGTPPILVRRELVTGDIAGMAKAAGILTATGSRTSHAAVVARQLAKVCLIGCEALSFDLERRTCRLGARVLAEGDPISLDGNAGAVYPGALIVLTERPERELAAIAAWRQESAVPAEAAVVR
jgi:pyruvate,orthophosphate dikinase